MAKSFSAYAPPMTWGPWTNVESHGGINSFRISYSPVGDTVVFGKVRYFKNIDSITEEDFKDSIVIRTADVFANIDVCFKGVPMGSAVEGEIG